MVLSGIVLIIIVIDIFVLFRNNWVRDVRRKCIWNDDFPATYNQLPSYGYMLFVKFWVFDINYFIRDRL